MDTNRIMTLPVETVGQAYLEILRARGIKYFFGNSGTDFGPIIDGLAKFAAEKKEFPKPITVPHEFVAVSMAQGYAMYYGRAAGRHGPRDRRHRERIGCRDERLASECADDFFCRQDAAHGGRAARQPNQLHPLGPGIFRSGQPAA